MKALMGFVFAVVVALLVLRTNGAGEVDKPADGNALNVQYAETQLKLAEANLAKVQRMNERTAKVVSQNVVDEYRRDVETARIRLEIVRDGRPQFPVWVQLAETNWIAARTAWEGAKAANQRVPNTVDALEVERLRLRMELGRLSLERGRAAAKLPREDQLAWITEFQNDEIQRLKEEVLRNTAPTTTMWYWR